MRILIIAFLMQIACSAWGQPELPLAELVVIDKSERKMWLITGGKKYREYNISLGTSPTGHKEREGDGRTPEGRYIIDYRNPESSFHLSLHINYPRQQDEENARKKDVSPGGDIFIHGLPNEPATAPRAGKVNDWTAGCIAVSNRDIEEIWALVKDGTPIEITG